MSDDTQIVRVKKETWRRLKLASLLTEKTMTEILESLVDEYCPPDPLNDQNAKFLVDAKVPYVVNG